jgi:putative oxidoreductase
MSMTITRVGVSNPIDAIRIIAGLFFVPHILFKVFDFSGAVEFFAKVGFPAPAVFVILAIICESAATAGMVFGLRTSFSALLGAAILGVAALAVFSAKGVVWLWNLGGVEYCLFWAVTCLVVAWAHWPDRK